MVDFRQRARHLLLLAKIGTIENFILIENKIMKYSPGSGVNWQSLCHFKQFSLSFFSIQNFSGLCLYLLFQLGLVPTQSLG